MSDVQHIDNQSITTFVLNTGSPHFVDFRKNIEPLDVFSEGRKIRNSDPFKKAGINVNFAEILGKNKLAVRTYERGVEDETYSCGTGATAAALAYFSKMNSKSIEKPIRISTKGGDLEVEFSPKSGGGFENIWLCGSTKQVYSGKIKLNL